MFRQWFVMPSLLGLLVALCTATGFAQQTLPAQPMFEAKGTWDSSGVAGHEEDKSTLWTREVGATAMWKPAFTAPVRARIALHKIVPDKNNDTRVQIEILHDGKIEKQILNFNEGQTGWVDLGIFAFAGKGEEGVRLTKTQNTGNARASAIRFDLMGEGTGQQVVQSLIIDDLYAPLSRPKSELLPLPAPFAGGPPKRGAWEITFRDEFNDNKLNFDVWQSESGAPGHILSSRWPENLEVKNGVLRLLTKREERGGRKWSSGSIWTKAFQQQFGYFEARMKIAPSTGLNNAFWLMTWKKVTDPHHFEIDITESHYPNRSHMTLHNWSGEHWARSKTAHFDGDLSADFHVYGLEWNAKEIIWSFDGVEMLRRPNEIAHDKCPIRFSTAVAHFAGRIAPQLDGTAMEVDWVRIYKERS